MNNQELKSFIKSFNKESGHFNEHELFEIGKKHKLEVPKSEKNWNNLAKEVGYRNNSGNAYRKFIEYHLKAENFVANANDETKAELFEKEKNLFKERVKLNDIYAKYKADLRDDARLEAFREALLKEARNSQPLKLDSHELIYKCSSDAHSREAILVLSDFHIGDCCDNFYNKYNLEIASKRITKLIYDVRAYCIEFGVRKLNIINLGDMIDGKIHRRPLSKELAVTKQVIAAAELFAAIINELSQVCEITYRSCTDNHARLTDNKEENIENENLNDLITWYLIGKFEGRENISIIEDNPDPSFGFFELKNGRKVIFAHGHLEKTNRAIDTFQTAMRQFIDYVILGHYHSAREKSFGGAKLIINGCLEGVNQYALEKRLFDRAEQKLLIFDDRKDAKNNLINISIDVQDI